MTRHPITIDRGLLAAEALRIMEERKITSLIVAGSDGAVEGVLHLHDLWHTDLF
jgi:arabinose-5-phosphate isomerase